MLWPSGIGWKVLDLETVAAWKKYSGRFQTLKNTLQSGQITNVVNHSYKYTPVIQLLEIHPFSSQHGDVSMKLYPCSKEPGQEVTIAGYSGTGQSRSWPECPHMPPARFSCGLCRSVLAWWHCDTGLWRVKHQPTLWWTPSHRTYKAVCDGHRPSPVLTVGLFSSEKLSFSSQVWSNTATCRYCPYVIQLSKKFSSSSSHSLMKDVISSSLCKSFRRMGKCLILWHTKIASWKKKPGLVWKPKGKVESPV